MADKRRESVLIYRPEFGYFHHVPRTAQHHSRGVREGNLSCRSTLSRLVGHHRLMQLALHLFCSHPWSFSFDLMASPFRSSTCPPDFSDRKKSKEKFFKEWSHGGWQWTLAHPFQMGRPEDWLPYCQFWRNFLLLVVVDRRRADVKIDARAWEREIGNWQRCERNRVLRANPSGSSRGSPFLPLSHVFRAISRCEYR